MKSAQEYYEGLEDKPDFTELTKTGIKSNLGNVWDFADSFAQSKIPVLSFSGEAKTIEILTIDPWVSVEERLPKPGAIVDIWTKGSGRVVDCNFEDDEGGVFTDNQDFSSEEYYVEDITHWMPLPEKPKQL